MGNAQVSDRSAKSQDNLGRTRPPNSDLQPYAQAGPAGIKTFETRLLLDS
jgi:hypothetical protein